jgi:hypothetical protein
VEHLGSGIPRILRAYGRECFKFTENFLRMIFPAVLQLNAPISEQVTEQVSEQVKKTRSGIKWKHLTNK